MSILTVARYSEDQAREWFEKKRWPHGAICPHCGSLSVTKLKAQSARPGLYQCRDCKKQFTVTVGTPLHRTQIPLHKWCYAIHVWAASKNNISSVELARTIEITQKSAWFMLQRIRLMASKEVTEKLKGTVEADEVYTGDVLKHEKTGKRGRGTAKKAVLVMVERSKRVKPMPFTPKSVNVGTGRVVAKPIRRSDAATIRGNLLTFVERTAAIQTDNFKAYNGLGKYFSGGHSSVRHSYIDKHGKRRREFVSKSGAHNNTAESFNARLRRGIRGTYHHVSKKHLKRYVDEMVFRWNTRMLNDNERAEEAVKDMNGKRLKYADLVDT